MFVNNSCLSNSMNCIIAPLNGIGGVYLGNLEAAQNPDLLTKYQIGAVLSVIDQSIQVRGAQKLWIMADDCEDFPLHKYFDQAIKFIDCQSQRTNVLIHCYAGISRSTTICAAFMMQKYRWNLNQTIRHIQQRRKLANPNPGFIQQLKDYEEKLKPKDRRSNGSITMHVNANKSRHGSVGYENNHLLPIQMNNQNQNSITPQLNRLREFNSKLTEYMHKWKIRERAH